MPDLNDRTPFFFVGVPRSGTTILFEAFSQHPELAWISNYARLAPRFLQLNLLRRFFSLFPQGGIGHKPQYGNTSFLNKFLPRPDEAYEFWRHYLDSEFSRSYLLGQLANSDEAMRLRRAVSRLCFYQGRPKFAAKLTGPGRIGFLMSIFPRARFVHVIRDGLAVISSLLRVPFWKEGGGLEQPWWHGGLDESDMAVWSRSGHDSAFLAAIQWRRIISTTREEVTELDPEVYVEVRYEDFVRDSHDTMARLFERVKLPFSRSVMQHLDSLHVVPDRNELYRKQWGTRKTLELITAMSPVYEELGYKLLQHGRSGGTRS